MANRRNKINDSKNKLLRGLILNIAVSSPALLGLGMILLSKGPLNPYVLSTSFFLAGFTGIIIIIRKESQMSIGSVHGKWAVFEGLVFTIVCWGIAVYVWLFGLA